jgi:glycosyltransferase involved in cell wall biosynthesis
MAMIRKLDPRVIHFQWLPLPILDQAFLTRLKPRYGLVLTLHNTTLFHGAVSPWRALGFKAALKRFDAIIVHTEFSRQRVLAREWADERKVHVVPHGALEYYTTMGSECSGERKTKNLLFFGNIHPYKGIDILLRGFARLNPSIAEATRLVIAGRPQMDVEPLRQLSRDLGIDSRVDWMLRPIAESEVPALFRSADAVVLPYREIDQSGVLMTAIAFGKPVLATRVGGIPEIIQDGVHGYLVEAEDVAALAHAADCLLSCKERRLEMESAVRALCKGSLGWSSIASKTLDLYRHVLEPRSSAEVVKSNTRFAHQRIGF